MAALINCDEKYASVWALWLTGVHLASVWALWLTSVNVASVWALWLTGVDVASVWALWLTGVGDDQGAGTRTSSPVPRARQHGRMSAAEWAVGVDRVSISHETIRRLTQWLVMNIHELHYCTACWLGAFLACESMRACSSIVSARRLRTPCLLPFTLIYVIHH